MQFPTPRGPNPDSNTLQIAPCASYNTVNNSAITTFPMNGNTIMLFDDGKGDLIYYYSAGNNGTFVKVSDPVILLKTDTYPRSVNKGVDLTLAGAKAGDQGVLQGVYASFDNSTFWYQCADIKVADAAAGSGGGAGGAGGSGGGSANGTGGTGGTGTNSTDTSSTPSAAATIISSTVLLYMTLAVVLMVRL